MVEHEPPSGSRGGRRRQTNLVRVPPGTATCFQHKPVPPPIKINAFHWEAWTDSGSVAAVCSVTSLAAVRVFAPIAASVAGAGVLAAVFSRHQPSVVPAAGVPGPASVGVSVAPGPASRLAFPVVAGSSGLASHSLCLEQRGVCWAAGR